MTLNPAIPTVSDTELAYLDLPQYQLRHSIQSHEFGDVIRIERASHPEGTAWNRRELGIALRQSSMRSMLVERRSSMTSLEGEIVGYVVYELGKSRIEVYNFAVTPEYRRQGIGLRMFRALKQVADQSTWCKSVRVLVRELNLPCQQFLKRMEFVCKRIEEDCFPDTDEPGYRFRYLTTLGKESVNART